MLWHTAAADDPMFSGPEFCRPPQGSTLADLYRAVDTEIERLTSITGPECSVFVFALHGMRAAWGQPTVVSQVLHADGLAHRPAWHTQSWRERVIDRFGAAKRRAPGWARRLYQGRTSYRVRAKLAFPTMLEPYDWSRTRAFALPTDHYGWVRVNLAGRERLGIVDGSEYTGLCDALETRFRGLATPAGAPLVADVQRPARDLEEARHSGLPDLVLNWADAAYTDALDLGDGIPQAPAVNRRRTGHHADAGFGVATGAVAELLEDTLPAEALAGVLENALGLSES
jgi:predicted AlkP superfamily phosphohydrolase/phosphomutase